MTKKPFGVSWHSFRVSVTSWGWEAGRGKKRPSAFTELNTRVKRHIWPSLSLKKAWFYFILISVLKALSDFFGLTEPQVDYSGQGSLSFNTWFLLMHCITQLSKRDIASISFLSVCNNMKIDKIKLFFLFSINYLDSYYRNQNSLLCVSTMRCTEELNASI